jgi:peptidoglycan/xylan/chitin deacetylase (PgdA/CDA1 family)
MSNSPYKIAATLALACVFFVSLCRIVPAAEQGGIPILLYHRFGPSVSDSMTVMTSTFEQQLAWLRLHGYRVVPLRALVDSLRGLAPPVEPPAVIITADDGHKSVYTDMFPIIKRENLPVTLFIYPSAISNASYALTWDELVEMKQTGLVDIQSHTWWHPNFHHERSRLTPEQYREFVEMQLVHSKELISRRLGGSVDMLAWPFGEYDDELEHMAARAGYVAAFTLERRHVRTGADLLALPRYLITDFDKGPRFARMIEPAAAARIPSP